RLRRDRRLRPEGGPALCVELRIADHRLEQLLWRRPASADEAHRRRQDEASDRQGAAARRGARRLAPDPGPQGDRQGGGDAVVESPMTEEWTAERVQELIDRAPYHQWLGLKVVAVH